MNAKIIVTVFWFASVVLSALLTLLLNLMLR